VKNNYICSGMCGRITSNLGGICLKCRTEMGAESRGVDRRAPDGGEINDTRILELQRSSDDNDELLDDPICNDQMLTIPNAQAELDWEMDMWIHGETL
jgi:hypothetical protein